MSPAGFAAFVELRQRKSQLEAVATTLRRKHFLQDSGLLAAARTLEASHRAKLRQELGDLRATEPMVTSVLMKTHIIQRSMSAVSYAPGLIGVSPPGARLKQQNKTSFRFCNASSVITPLRYMSIFAYIVYTYSILYLFHFPLRVVPERNFSANRLEHHTPSCSKTYLRNFMTVYKRTKHD